MWHCLCCQCDSVWLFPVLPSEPCVRMLHCEGFYRDLACVMVKTAWGLVWATCCTRHLGHLAVPWFRAVVPLCWCWRSCFTHTNCPQSHVLKEGGATYSRPLAIWPFVLVLWSAGWARCCGCMLQAMSGNVNGLLVRCAACSAPNHTATERGLH